MAHTAFHVPCVWLEDTGAVTTNASIFGFDYLSREQPPAVLRLEWSDSVPPEWRPIVDRVDRMRKFLSKPAGDAAG